MPITVPIRAEALHAWLAPALTTAGTDASLPVLTCVQVHVRADHLLAVTTDRYRATVSRHRRDTDAKPEAADAWTIPDDHQPIHLLLSAGAVRRMLALFPLGRSRARQQRLIYLELDEARLRVSDFSGLAVALDFQDGTFPNVLSLFAQAVVRADGDDATAPISLNFRLLADYRVAASRYAPTAILPTGMKKPYLLPMHEDCLGLLMPKSRPDGSVSADPIAPVWADALGVSA